MIPNDLLDMCKDYRFEAHFCDYVHMHDADGTMEEDDIFNISPLFSPHFQVKTNLMFLCETSWPYWRAKRM